MPHLILRAGPLSEFLRIANIKFSLRAASFISNQKSYKLETLFLQTHEEQNKLSRETTVRRSVCLEKYGHGLQTNIFLEARSIYPPKKWDHVINSDEYLL